MEYINKIFNGDSCEILTEIDDNSIDMIITSPPMVLLVIKKLLMLKN